MVRRSICKLFVEGGGNDNHALKTACRRAFTNLLKSAGLDGRMPRIVACGSRGRAYDQFCHALGDPHTDLAVLLVDAEAAVTARSPWDHVKTRKGDEWDKPKGASDDQLHLMIVCMESWFLADREALRKYFGPRFRESSLPANPKVEEISKTDVYSKLKKATEETTKGAYDKGAHSFNILGLVDPARLRRAAPSADRLLTYLDSVL